MDVTLCRAENRQREVKQFAIQLVKKRASALLQNTAQPVHKIPCYTSKNLEVNKNKTLYTPMIFITIFIAVKFQVQTPNNRTLVK